MTNLNSPNFPHLLNRLHAVVVDVVVAAAVVEFVDLVDANSVRCY